jgi:hypothetical protein
MQKQSGTPIFAYVERKKIGLMEYQLFPNVLINFREKSNFPNVLFHHRRCGSAFNGGFLHATSFCMLMMHYKRRTKDSRFLKMEDWLIADSLTVFGASPILSSSVMVSEPDGMFIATVKADVHKSFLVRGFLRCGFLGLSTVVPVV